MNLYDIDDIQQGNQGFIIDSDSKADWACKVIRSEQAEAERLINAIDEEIAMLNEKKKLIEGQFETKTAYLKSKLQMYFRVLPRSSNDPYTMSPVMMIRWGCDCAIRDFI
jgi:hypothetical protein